MAALWRRTAHGRGMRRTQPGHNPPPNPRPACLRFGEVDAVSLGRLAHPLVRPGQADHAGVELLDVITNLDVGQVSK